MGAKAKEKGNGANLRVAQRRTNGSLGVIAIRRAECFFSIFSDLGNFDGEKRYYRPYVYGMIMMRESGVHHLSVARIREYAIQINIETTIRTCAYCTYWRRVL